MELLVPAGSRECLEAAVMHGADAVYLGGQRFNARKYADNFDDDSLLQAVEFCHLHGVRVYVTVNTVVFDRELEALFHYADFLSQIGVDAVIVQDVGAVSVIRQAAPELPIHASTQMVIHDLPGVLAAKDLGLSRVVLARELSLSEIRHIADNTDVELEIFGHGALCMSYSGQCYMSSIIGGRSGNRGRCAQPCRLNYRIGDREGQFLSLKDLCSLDHLDMLKSLGVASLKVEGRMKGPHYVATVTDVYRSCIDGKKPDKTDYERLQSAFDRSGFTDGYLTGKTGVQMFSYQRPENPYHPIETSKKKKRIAITGACSIKQGQPAVLFVEDGVRSISCQSTELVEAAQRVSISRERVLEQLEKTNNTPFFFSDIRLELEAGCALPIKVLNALRREALDRLTTARKNSGKRSASGRTYAQRPSSLNEHVETKLYVSVETHEQAVAVAKYADLLFLPKELWDNRKAYLCEAALTVPRLASENTLADLRAIAERDQAAVLVSDLGQVRYFSGIPAYGAFELNATNSETLLKLKEMGLVACGVSYEVSLRRIRDLSKSLPLFVFAYGHMPLMITKNCLIHSATKTCGCPTDLVDRTGATFSVVQGTECRNEIRNGTVLFNADRLSDFSNIGLSALFLKMTSETPDRCEAVLKMYRGESVVVPKSYTRGHLYKIIE